MSEPTVTLYRPVGAQELALIAESGEFSTEATAKK
jgi:hypothetical protein